MSRISYINKKLNRNWIFDKTLGFSYEFNTDIGNKLYYEGSFEETEIEFLNCILKIKNKPIILDIGSNIGIHSISLAKKNQEATIYSFEPSPHTREILEFNIRANRLKDRVIVLPYAVSDHTGKAVFYHTNDNAYSSLKDTMRKSIVQTVEAELITIDHFIELNKIQTLDLVKIDVEGFDNEVVLGGLKTFKKFKPEIFIEIYQGVNSNPNPLETINLLKNIGYNAYVMVEGKKQLFEIHSDSSYNYYFSFK